MADSKNDAAQPSDKRTEGAKPELDAARQQQHTGNHDRPERSTGGADRFGATRTGAGNVEGGEGSS